MRVSDTGPMPHACLFLLFIIEGVIFNFNFSSFSKSPKNVKLSRNLIALLCHGGVPKEYFMELLMKDLEDTHSVFCKRRAAFKGVKLIVFHNFFISFWIIWGLIGSRFLVVVNVHGINSIPAIYYFIYIPLSLFLVP